jgi:hypothetical protein
MAKIRIQDKHPGSATLNATHTPTFKRHIQAFSGAGTVAVPSRVVRRHGPVLVSALPLAPPRSHCHVGGTSRYSTPNLVLASHLKVKSFRF